MVGVGVGGGGHAGRRANGHAAQCASSHAGGRASGRGVVERAVGWRLARVAIQLAAFRVGVPTIRASAIANFGKRAIRWGGYLVRCSGGRAGGQSSKRAGGQVARRADGPTAYHGVLDAGARGSNVVARASHGAAG